MMLGVDHIGVGVPDMDRALAFYAELGFRTVAFDYTGPLPGLEPVAGREVGEARVVVLRSENPTKLGPGSLKLVQTLDAAVPPLPEGIGWGEPGICEICMHVKDQEALHRRLVDGGVPSLMEPNETVTTPNDAACGLSYVADPFGSKIELIEWLGLQDGWPTPSGPQGVNHVAFGVTDSAFIMGSMGSVVGEKLTRTIERATTEQLPLIIISGSGGGARMHEGVLSLIEESRNVFVAEEHNTRGGVATAVADTIVDNRMNGVKLVRIGFPSDEYSAIAAPYPLYQYYGLDAAGVAARIRQELR